MHGLLSLHAWYHSPVGGVCAKCAATVWYVTSLHSSMYCTLSGLHRVSSCPTFRLSMTWFACTTGFIGPQAHRFFQELIGEPQTYHYILQHGHLPSQYPLFPLWQFLVFMPGTRAHTGVLITVVVVGFNVQYMGQLQLNTTYLIHIFFCFINDA